MFFRFEEAANAQLHLIPDMPSKSFTDFLPGTADFLDDFAFLPIGCTARHDQAIKRKDCGWSVRCRAAIMSLHFSEKSERSGAMNSE